jgi:general secretion pathway protein L
MAQRILGLDVGASRVKGVLLESSYRGFAVLDAGAEAVEPGEAPLRDRQAEAARRLLANRAWAFEVSMAALPGAVASHVLALPFTDPRRIEQTIGFEIEAQIPFDLAEVAWDWQVLGMAADRTELLAAVVRREELAGFLAALAGVGVDPRAVLPPGPAYASLWACGLVEPLVAQAAPAPEAEPAGGPQPETPSATGPAAEAAEGLLDVGRSRSSLCIVVGGRCEAARTFAAGAQDAARGLVRELGLTDGDAERLLAAAAAGQTPPPELAAAAADPRALAALRHALQPVLREVRATLRAWRARPGARPVARLLLAGELARLPDLAELLRAEADGPVEPLRLAGAAADRIPAEMAPGMALALALALRGHQGSRAPRLNLRRGGLAFTRDFEHLRGRALRMAAAAGLVLLLAVVSTGVKVFALSRQEALLDRALCDTTQRITGKCYDDFEVAVSVLRGKGTASAVVPRMSALDVFTELSMRTPPGVPVRFDRIEIARDKIHLQGTTDAAENVDKIVSSLRASRCFAEARSLGARRRSTDQKFEFSVDSDLGCETGAAPAGGRG